MTKAQINEAKALIGTMPREEIADQIGVSLVNLKRAFRGTRLAFHNKYVLNPKLVREVCAFYEKHGKKKTQERFPQVRVRSVVEHYKLFKPRQTRWTDAQFVELAKMGGLVSFEDQAKFFKRPRANAGSIRSAWMKRMGFGGGGMHGLSKWKAIEIAKPSCPKVRTKFWETRHPGLNRHAFSREIYLWVDLEKHLKEGCPDFIQDAVSALADFQRFLFGPDPRSKILELIKTRSR